MTSHRTTPSPFAARIGDTPDFPWGHSTPRSAGTDGSRSLRITHRLITQGQHVWIVREADTSLAAHAPAPHCLLCESALSVRTAWTYPTDWARLNDAELLSLFR